MPAFNPLLAASGHAALAQHQIGTAQEDDYKLSTLERRPL
jgi:hypothetical protein